MSPWRPAAWASLRTGSVLASEELCRVLLSAGLDGWDTRHNWGLAVGFLQGRLQWVWVWGGCPTAVLWASLAPGTS